VIRSLAVPLVCAGCLVLCGSARAITPTITEFSTGLNTNAKPLGITAGPDGNLWFADTGDTPAIGRITPGGQITEFSSGIASNSQLVTIAAGPDGNLWFADERSPGAIGRIDPATGQINEFSTGLASGSDPKGIVAGPDGGMWFTDFGSTPAIGRIDPATETIDEFTAGLTSDSSPDLIVAGPDGRLWFTDVHKPAIGRIDPTTHQIDEFSAGLSSANHPEAIAAGADGNLWFTDFGVHTVGRATPAGGIGFFSTGLNPGANPDGVAAGPNGNLWFTDGEGSVPAIGFITPQGQISEFSAGLSGSSDPAWIALGPDGNLWFTDVGTRAIGRVTTPPIVSTTGAVATGPTSARITGSANGHAQPTTFHVEYGVPGGPGTTTTAEQSLGTTAAGTPLSAALTGLKPSTSYQARVVVTNPTGATAGAFVTFTTPVTPRPQLSRLKISPRTFLAARRGPTLIAAKPSRTRKPGTVVSYRDSQAARAKFTVERPVQGRRRGHACRAPSRRNRRGRRCVRYVVVGHFTHVDAAGANLFRFTGRARRRTLRPGRYRLAAVAVSGSVTGRPVNASFVVKRSR
jgi:streptogramin lyase